jgi:phage protein D
MKLAQRSLRSKNKNEVTGLLDMIGHPGMRAGLNINVSGYGDFDGKYFVEKAMHSQAVGSGYTTSVSIRKVLGY